MSEADGLKWIIGLLGAPMVILVWRMAVLTERVENISRDVVESVKYCHSQAHEWREHHQAIELKIAKLEKGLP